MMLFESTIESAMYDDDDDDDETTPPAPRDWHTHISRKRWQVLWLIDLQVQSRNPHFQAMRAVE